MGKWRTRFAVHMTWSAAMLAKTWGVDDTPLVELPTSERNLSAAAMLDGVRRDPEFFAKIAKGVELYF